MNRKLVAEHYLNKGITSILGGGVYKSTASAADTSKYAFKGTKVAHTATVRCDLNGYSSWSHNKTIAQKIEMLDHFFSSVVPLIDTHNGIYYRDEGDCVIALFSNYFSQACNIQNIINFSQAATCRRYGPTNSSLTVKTIVNFGDIAYFQKTHEKGSFDWSAEGEVMIHSARFENAVESKPRIYLFKEDCETYFLRTEPSLSTYIHYEKAQIPGLKLQSGWKDIAFMHYNI